MMKMEPNEEYESIMLYLGLSIAGWRELIEFKNQNRHILPNEILEELVKLRGKISFYESRINQMYQLVKAS